MWGQIALVLSAAALFGSACGEVVSPEQDAGSVADGAPADPDAAALPEWHFGRPTPLVGVHVDAGSHRSPRFARRGLALYFVADAASGQLHVATRSSRSARFEAPSPVTGADLADYQVESMALSADELELFVQARPVTPPDGLHDIYRATRAEIDGSFSALELVTEVSVAGYDDTEPFLSADGLEIVFASSRVGGSMLFSALREAPGRPFDEPAMISLRVHVNEARSPTLSADGRRLFFSGRVDDSEVRTYGMIRPEYPDFPGRFEVAELNQTGVVTDQLQVSEATGEVVFRSNRAWSPAAESIWIAQLCEGAPCDEPEVSCPEGVLSADRRHCYWFEPPETAADWDTMRERCGGEGASLATVHSAAEDELVVNLSGSSGNTADVWVGGHDRDGECNVSIPGCTFAWATGEPFIYNRWFIGEPNDGEFVTIEDCMTYRPVQGAYNDDGCEKPFPAVCERELFPPW